MDAPSAVLVADDEPSLLRLLARLLGEAGYEVLAARDGDEALAVFAEQRERVGAAVLDAAILPRGADEIVAAMSRDGRGVRFVLVSGDPLGGDLAARARALGAVFLAKPFPPRALLAALEKALAGASGAEPATGAA